MKKILLSFAIIALLASCKDETQEKLDAAQDAVTEEVKEKIDSAKIKAERRLDSIKEKTKAEIDSAKIKRISQIKNKSSSKMGIFYLACFASSLSLVPLCSALPRVLL